MDIKEDSTFHELLISLLNKYIHDLRSHTIMPEKYLLLMDLFQKDTLLESRNLPFEWDDVLKYTFLGAYIYHLIDKNTNNKKENANIVPDNNPFNGLDIDTD